VTCLSGWDEIVSIVTGRQDEFERTAMPHSRSLLRVARRIASDPATAEDLVQETYLRAWRSFDQFRAGTNARAWLFRILFNAFYAQGRRVKSNPVLVSLEQPNRSFDPQDGRSLSMIDAAAVNHALAALSAEHRAVLMLSVVEGFTCREMAEILALPIGTVMSRMSRARQAMRDRLSPLPAEVPRAHASADWAERGAS
jgi:RNA polymerase sigma-70 factor, ECF subfamily